jgi:hypothetical protein
MMLDTEARRLQRDYRSLYIMCDEAASFRFALHLEHQIVLGFPKNRTPKKEDTPVEADLAEVIDDTVDIRMGEPNLP